MIYGDNNKFLSKAIFWEMSTPERREKYPPLYTLKLEEHEGLPSAYQIYMECVDEYEAAIKLTGSMKNWRFLCASHWFMEGAPEHGHEGLKQWRLDMEARDRSIAKRQLIAAAEDGNVTAQRTLYGAKTSAPAKKKVAEERGKKTGAIGSKVSSLMDRMER